MVISGEICLCLQQLLKWAYYLGPLDGQYSSALAEANLQFHSCENLEEKYREGYLAVEFYEYLRRYGLKHASPPILEE